MINYNSRQWVSICWQMRGSVLPRLLPRVLIAAGIGTVAAYLHLHYGFKAPPIAHTLIGVALGLLLVFRTNASYDRYWEGRKLMATIASRASDLARQTVSFLEGPEEVVRKERAEIGRLICLLYAVIRQDLRAERDLKGTGIELRAAEKKILEASDARVVTVAAWISTRLNNAVATKILTEGKLRSMDPNVVMMVDSWGGTGRIRNTPIPFAYAQHIKIFVLLWGFTVPFAMADALDWYTPIASAVLAFALFGIDEIGVEIEDPFGYDANDLPLDEIGAGLNKTVEAVMACRLPNDAASQEVA